MGVLLASSMVCFGVALGWFDDGPRRARPWDFLAVVSSAQEGKGESRWASTM